MKKLHNLIDLLKKHLIQKRLAMKQPLRARLFVYGLLILSIGLFLGAYGVLLYVQNLPYPNQLSIHFPKLTPTPSPSPEPTPVPSPVPSPVPTPSPTPTPKKPAMSKPKTTSHPQPNTNTWSADVQAWIYPGDPACGAANEYKDGRKIAVLKPQYFSVGTDGALLQQTVASAGCNAYNPQNASDIKQHSQAQYVTVSADSDSMAALVGDTALSSKAVATLHSFVQTTGFTGVELDFEGFGQWDDASYAGFLRLVSSLGTTLHQSGKKLMVDGPPIGNATEQGYYKWKYSDLNQQPVDMIVVMAYDNDFDQGAGKAIAPNDWVAGVVNWAKGQVDINKLVIGVPSYGYHGGSGSYKITNDTKDQSSNLPGFATATRDPSSSELIWSSGGVAYDYQDTQSLNQKRALIESLGIKHISVWHLGGNDWFSGKQEP